MITFFSVSAQTYRGTIRGTVSDPSGAVIPGADIKLKNEATNETRAAQTDPHGQYSVSSLRPGAYLLDVNVPNFMRAQRTLTLLVNQEIRVDIEMALSGDQVSVDVTNDLKEDSPALGTVIDNKQVTGLPLDGRNFYELTLLSPGAVPAAPGSAGSVRGDFAFSVNGAREDANNFLLDGVYNVDPKLNTFGVRPSVEAIREFEMLTSTYDASFGRNPGAQVNVVSEFRIKQCSRFSV